MTEPRRTRAEGRSKSRVSPARLVFAGFLWLACSDADEAVPRDVSARVSEAIRTVVKVTFTTDAPAQGYVEYGTTPSLGLRTPSESTASVTHERDLLGLSADTDYYYRVVASSGGEEAKGDVLSIRTGNLPLGMPPLTLEGDGHAGFVLVPVLGATTAVLVLDSAGRIVWYHEDDRELDFYRARLAVDRKSILYNAASVSGTPSDASELVRVSLDGSSTTSIPVPLLAHDFVEHPDGTLAAIVVEYREFQGEELRGDQIVEVDPDGNLTTVWSAWDCFDPETTPGDDIALGWTFANALDFDPEVDAYYLGMRNFSSIAKIDRKTRTCEWVLGTFGATLDFAAGSTRFLHQHQFQIRGDRMLVFDNEGSAGNESRVLEYTLDFAANLATEVWRYVSEPPVYTFVLGEPTRLENGDTFVNWSAAGQMERVSPDGVARWRVNSGVGYAFGFNTLAEDLYSGPE
jgi:hypothetical protein